MRGGLTRRDVLRGAAAAGAASLILPTRGLGAPAPQSTWIGSVNGSSLAVRAPQAFSLVGVSWEGPRGASIELRTQAPGGRGWSRWVVASTLGHDGDDAGAGRLFGEPIWSGRAESVQLRSAGPVHGVRLHFVTGDGDAVRATTAMPLAQPVLDAGPGQPPVIARSAWARGQAPPAVAAHLGSVKLAFVHHSEGANGYGAAEVPAILRSIFDYHRYVRGFWDIGYNFAIDAYGRVWEARAGGIDKPVIGAHAGGYNAVSTGVVVLGNFMSTSPSAVALRALERLLAWKLSLHGVPARGRVTVQVNPSDAFYTPFPRGAHVSLPRVAGHRDGDSTDCPGNVLYGQLPAVRSRVAGLAGTPLRLTIAGAPPTAVAPVTVELTGSLSVLGGAPVEGATLELQQLAPGASATLATTATAADGSWSAQLTLSGSAALRVLHRDAPAVVSDVAQIAVAPAVTLAVAPGPPVQVSGTVTPPKPYVTIEVRRGRRVIKRRRVAVSGGKFAAVIAVARPGDVLRATTAGDRVNAPGTSAAVPVAGPAR